MPPPSASLTAIVRFPVKSCRGQTLTEAVVEPWGLLDDRRWMVVDADGDAVTAREVNALVLVEPTLTEAGLRLEAPGASALDVRRPDPSRQREVRLWSSRLTAADAGDEAAAWMSAVTGRDARLVWLDDPTRRPTSPQFSRPEDRVSLADGYPLLLATEESLARLSDEALGGPDGHGGHGGGDEPLSMARFRPNLVVRGHAAWSEDDWRRVRIGGPDGVVFRAVKGCARCVMTTVDPETAERGKEPLRTLARSRRFDGATWFGINLVPDVPADASAASRTVRLGDPVEVLEVAEAGSGPMRAGTVGRPA